MALPTGTVPDRVLLVEGRDDKHVVDHICRRHASIAPFKIRGKGGLDELLASIGPELRAPGRRTLGMVVDANDDIEARWAAVTDRLARAGIEVGNRDPEGTVTRATSGDPDVGVWIMPDNRSAGELEDFVAAMMPRADPVWPLSQSVHRRYSIHEPPIQPQEGAAGQGQCVAGGKRAAPSDGTGHRSRRFGCESRRLRPVDGVACAAVR